MRNISLTQPPSILPAYSFLLHGDTRSGKSHWTATMPRPYIYADIAESGWKTILEMDRSQWFEPDVEPIIRGIDAMSDIAASQIELDALIASKRVMTIVIDAFSFYCDFFLAHLFRLQGADKQDNRRAYGDLGKHLREVRTILGTKGINVAYNCLSKHPDEDDPKCRPLIPGQQANKFAAGVDFLWYAELKQKLEAGKVVSETHQFYTRQYGCHIAGNRLGARAGILPNPFSGNYSDFLAVMGYDVDEIRNALPPIKATAAIPVPPPARPPITRAVSKVSPSVSTPRVSVPTTNSNTAQRGPNK